MHNTAEVQLACTKLQPCAGPLIEMLQSSKLVIQFQAFRIFNSCRRLDIPPTNNFFNSDLHFLSVEGVLTSESMLALIKAGKGFSHRNILDLSDPRRDVPGT